MAPNIVNTNDESQIIYKKHNQNSKQHEENVANNNVPDKKQINYASMLPSEIGTDYNFKREIVWFNAIGFLILHLMGVYGVYVAVVYAQWYTILWSLVVLLGGAEGVVIGAHRMYSHKALKGRFITRLVLVTLQTIAGQNCMYIWVRDHRQHHKFSDTDADPHNANRGFFFSHMGWLMSRKHPAVIAKGKTIDMSDLEADPIIMVQKLFYKPLYLVFAIAIPVMVPVYYWNESYWNSFFVAYMARYIISLNGTWLVNSAAHLYGYKPYDKNILPVETRFVDMFSLGEGWHNYHHAFPWDYRAAELGVRYSPTTMIIDILSKFNLVYDLKCASKELVEKKCKRTGDGTHPVWKNEQTHATIDGDVDLKGHEHVNNQDDVDEDIRTLTERGY